jgi:hypothetical protein
VGSEHRARLKAERLQSSGRVTYAIKQPNLSHRCKPLPGVKNLDNNLTTRALAVS